MRLRLLVGVGVAVAVVLLPAAAWAHVTVNPSEAPKGGSAELAFRVPNEMENADTTKVDVQFPTDHPIADVSVQPKPGWTYEVKTTKLAKPITTDDGQVTETVGEITWSGGTIKPGEYDDFTVSVEGLPTDVDQIEFKTIQTYSNGQEVAWIEDTPASGEEPEHPAPVLKLTAASGDDHSASPTTTAPSGQASTKPAADTASQSDVDSAKTLAVVALILAIVGALVGGAALFLRRSGGSAD